MSWSLAPVAHCIVNPLLIQSLELEHVAEVISTVRDSTMIFTQIVKILDHLSLKQQSKNTCCYSS